jgi:hypothetical protein
MLTVAQYLALGKDMQAFVHKEPGPHIHSGHPLLNTWHSTTSANTGRGSCFSGGEPRHMRSSSWLD